MVEVVSPSAVSGAFFAVRREEGVSFIVLLVAVGALPFGGELVAVADGLGFCVGLVGHFDWVWCSGDDLACRWGDRLGGRSLLT